MMHSSRWLMGLVLATGLWLGPRESDACGGFFCNNQPIDQAGEKILFVMEEGHVTAHIQIQYQGEAEAFSWVVPTTVVPEISVGTDEIFPILQNQTQPYVNQDVQYVHCGGGYGDDGGDADGDADVDGDTDADTDTDSGGVNVIQASTVGPFETVTLASDDPEALLQWLRDNEYVIPPAAEPIIAAYVESNSYFVGLKLTKGADVGDLQPIVLDLDTSEACVPLRLTAIAAVPNMPVTVWFVGDGPAVSTNFPDVRPNDVLFHLPNATLGYDNVVSGAIDAVGGRAFVTEFAGASWPLHGAIGADRYDTAAIRGAIDPVEVMQVLLQQGFTSNGNLYTILLEYLPPPAGAAKDPRSFYNCPDCYDLTGYTFDADALADALEDRIVRPLREIEVAVASHTHLTRLFTTLSPSEMTEDPFFAINPDRPLVARELSAGVIVDCHHSHDWRDRTSAITTAHGHHACVGYNDEPPPMPLYDRVVQWSATGAGEVLADESDAIAAALPCDGAGGDADADADADADGDADGGAHRSDGGLCTAAPGAPPGEGGVLLAALLVAAFLTRRPRP